MKTKMLGTMIMAVLLISNNALATDTTKESFSMLQSLNQNNLMLPTDSNETSVITRIDKRELQAIIKVMPEEFKNYEKQLKKDYGMSDAKLTLSLVSRAMDLMKNNSDPNKQEDYNRTYCVAWQLTQDIMRKTKDSEIKKLILNNWNSSLKKDDGYVPYQVYAIRDPNLFNDDFWKLLEKTKRKSTITSICVMLLGFANKENAQFYTEMLMKKQDTEIEGESKGDIQNTLNWIKYKISGDKTKPGPAKRHLLPDFKGKPE